MPQACPGTAILIGLTSIVCAFVTPLAAQESAEQHSHTMPAVSEPTAWQWSVDTNAFVGLNHQQRKFRDFNAFESQNWLMAVAKRPSKNGSLLLSSMFSLETWTLEDLGSPQVFQTGETFHGVPLIDRQHPHDLMMGLGGEYPADRGNAIGARGCGHRWIPDARPACVHAPSVIGRESTGTTGTPLPGFHSHHARRAARWGRT